MRLVGIRGGKLTMRTPSAYWAGSEILVDDYGPNLKAHDVAFSTPENRKQTNNETIPQHPQSQEKLSIAKPLSVTSPNLPKSSTSAQMRKSGHTPKPARTQTTLMLMDYERFCHFGKEKVQNLDMGKAAIWRL